MLFPTPAAAVVVRRGGDSQLSHLVVVRVTDPSRQVVLYGALLGEVPLAARRVSRAWGFESLLGLGHPEAG